MESKKKQENRIKRHKRVRARIIGTSDRPRVSVFRSNKHIFVQVIDDNIGKTILSSQIVSKKKTKIKGSKTEIASKIGKLIAEKMKSAGIKEVIFDRGGFKYHGRIKALADSIRKVGVKI